VLKAADYPKVAVYIPNTAFRFEKLPGKLPTHGLVDQRLTINYPHLALVIARTRVDTYLSSIVTALQGARSWYIATGLIRYRDESINLNPNPQVIQSCTKSSPSHGKHSSVAIESLCRDIEYQLNIYHLSS